MHTDLGGLLVIVKGGYVKGKAPQVFNAVSEDTNWIGGYNPYDETTQEWYMLYERKEYHCIGSTASFEHIQEMVFNTIVRYKTQKTLFKALHSMDTCSYPIQEEMMRQVIDTYGDYYMIEVEREERRAEEVLKEETVFGKAKKRLKKRTQTPSVVIEETPKVTLPTTSTTTGTSVRKNRLVPKKRNIKVEY